MISADRGLDRDADRDSIPDSIPGSALLARLNRPWLVLLLPVLLALLEAVLLNPGTAWWKTGLNCVSALGLLLRTRWPAVSLALTLPGTYFTESWIAPLTAVYTVASRPTRLPFTVLGAAAFVLADYFTWAVAGANSTADALVLSRVNALALIQSLMLGIAPVALGLLARTRRELTMRLDELTRGQRREARLLAERVLATERARLAREMHDVVSHQVSLISVQAGGLQVSTTDPAAEQTARTIRELSVRTLEELRQMVGVLRAAAGADAAAGAARPAGRPLAPQPRLADLPRLIEESGLAVQAELSPGDRDWPEPVQRAAYRTVQEALTNISKHAPGAEVRVRLRTRGGRLLVDVLNGPAPARVGAGPEPLPGGGHGLVGLRERAQLLGGSLTAGPTPEQGFAVHSELPAVARLQ